ncbi:hypothetical protein [Algoriphagus boritolerans]|uniref:hypothetical protein n=1 Tax=Algoriphagus boritolerans TaxID=308111 RepID=UPI000AA7BEDB
MKYFSTNNPNHKVSLAEAVIKGLAPDNGLYMPERIPVLPQDLMMEFSEMSFQEIGYAIISALFSEDLSASQIRELVDHTLTFDAPLVQVEEDVYSWNCFMDRLWRSRTLEHDFAPS